MAFAPDRWDLIDTGEAPAEAIMAKDEVLLKGLRADSSPAIHLYAWKGNCATYGYFVDPFRVLDREAVAKHKLSLARRPTGGGIIFHLTDFAFSILIPSSHPHYSLNTLDNYLFINRLVGRALRSWVGEVDFLTDEPVPLSQACGCFCMAKPTQYDIMLEGRKVGGAAQRRTKQGFLHQGTISLALPPAWLLEEVVLPGHQVSEAMQRYTFPLLGSQVSDDQLNQARSEIKRLLVSEVMSFL